MNRKWCSLRRHRLYNNSSLPLFVDFLSSLFFFWVFSPYSHHTYSSLSTFIFFGFRLFRLLSKSSGRGKNPEKRLTLSPERGHFVYMSIRVFKMYMLESLRSLNVWSQSCHKHYQKNNSPSHSISDKILGLTTPYMKKYFFYQFTESWTRPFKNNKPFVKIQIIE